MINRNKKKKWIFRGTVFFVAAVIGICCWMFLSREIQHALPVPGFSTWLPGKDICALAIDGDVIWAGGSDGLFKIVRTADTQTVDNRNVHSQNLNNKNTNNLTAYDQLANKQALDTQTLDKQIVYNHGMNNGQTMNSKIVESQTGSGDGNWTYKSEKMGDYRYVKALLIHGEEIWVGHDQGVSILKEDRSITFTSLDNLPDNRVNALCLDKTGRIWVGTWGGIAVFQNGQLERTIRAKDGLIDDMVNVIMEDSNGGMWFGSYVAPRGGVSVLYNDTWQLFSTDNALIHANVNTIIQKKDGTVLVGGGLYTKGGGTGFSCQNGKWVKTSTLEKKDGLAGAKIRSLFEDQSGRLWVGSEYEGLAVLGNKKSLVMTTRQGLSNNEVKAFKQEKDGTLWIGTREGLVRIDKGEIANSP